MDSSLGDSVVTTVASVFDGGTSQHFQEESCNRGHYEHRLLSFGYLHSASQ